MTIHADPGMDGRGGTADVRNHGMHRIDYNSRPSYLRHCAMNQNPLRTGLVPLHILYHAAKGEIYGVWMIDELRRHGYKVGPGTLYPMLHRLEERGYLRVREERDGRVMRRYYRATVRGQAALKSVLPQVRELFEELIEHQTPRRR